MKRPGPDTRDGPVSRDAVRALLVLLYSQSADIPDLSPLIPLAPVARHARRFKLDVSVDLSPGGLPRASINDTGEPEAFRERLRRTGAIHAISTERLDAWFALCRPGDCQATLSLKWGSSGARPRRTGLYYEELFRHPSGRRLWADAFRWAGCPLPEPLPGIDGAVCVDLDGDRIVGIKDYWIEEGSLPGFAPESLKEFLAAVPAHPRTGERRFLFARRFDPDGELTGFKLLWMTEAGRPEYATLAWRAMSELQKRFAGGATPNYTRMRRWVEAWPYSDDCIPYPDLISLNTNAAGEPQGLIAYVSVK